MKVVLAEKHLTNKWLADKLGKDPGTISKWCTNSMQPNLETLREIAVCLDVQYSDFLWPIEKNELSGLIPFRVKVNHYEQ